MYIIRDMGELERLLDERCLKEGEGLGHGKGEGMGKGSRRLLRLSPGSRQNSHTRKRQVV